MSARVLTILLGLAILLGAVAAPAVAQPQARPDQPAAVAAPAGVQAPKPPPRSATVAGKQVSDRDVFTKRADAGKTPDDGSRPKSTTGMVVGFWLFALLAVAGSIFVITRRNLITGVMGMVGTFFAIAALYMMLYAHFVAVIQMLVYAGAIMVLFVFVIMILNKPEADAYSGTGKPGKVLAGVAMAYLVYRLAGVLLAVDDTVTKAQLAPPEATAQGYDWGSTAAVGWNLFNEYLFPFEAISILLLVAVVGSIAIARPLAKDDTDGEAGEAGEAGSV